MTKPSRGTTGSTGYVLGVDLGTTFTAAAVFRSGTTEIVPLGDHAAQVPSAILRTEGSEVLMGESALRRGAEEPSRLAREFKRRVGDDTNIIVGGVPTSAHALMSQLLGWVVTQVTRGQGGPPELVLLTCPANWGPYRRELLEQAARMAGVASVRLCAEPEAAAIHFASTTRVEPGQLVAVYDLGGGTFDAAVLRKETTTSFTLLGAPEGIEHLGGLDFDTAVLEHVWRSLGPIDVDPDEPSVVRALGRLSRDCTAAKEALSTDTSVSIAVSLGPVQRTVRLNRSEFEDLVRPSLELTVDSLQRALHNADVSPDQLSAVVLIGGSARIPLVTDLLTQHLGRPVAMSSQPKHAVAMGAAIAGSDSLTSAPATDPGLATRTSSSQPSAAERAPQPRVSTSRKSSPAPRNRASSSRGSRRATMASVGLGAAALLIALLGPTATESVQVDLDRETGMTTDVSEVLPLSADSTMTLTFAGRHLPGTDAARVQDGAFNLGGSKAYTAGPLRAAVTGSGGTETPAIVTPSGSSWWSRLLTIPGAVLVLAALFAFAYAESLLRPVMRGRGRTHRTTILGMAGVGLVLAGVLALSVWIIGLSLLTPFTLATVVILTTLGAAALPLALRRR
ncbi:MAG: Hsp70 family protein [Ornithinimicrobium sp.]